MIRVEDGLELLDLQAALVCATETVEELRREDPLASQDWHGFRLEVVNRTGRIVHEIPLVLSVPGGSPH